MIEVSGNFYFYANNNLKFFGSTQNFREILNVNIILFFLNSFGKTSVAVAPR